MGEAADERELPKVERFAQLLATCQRRVFVYAMGILHNAADAEEVLQETNLVLWRKFDQYEPGTEFGRWACRVAHYEVLKFRERKPRKEKLFSNEFVEAIAVESKKQIDVLDRRREALDACLQRLSPKDRQLVMHRYQKQATTKTVAEALGRSVQGTRKSLHRIRMALLECIKRKMIVEERT